MTIIDPDAIHGARRFMIRTLASQLEDEFMALRGACLGGLPYAPDDGRAGERRLANLCLSFLMALGRQDVIGICLEQYYRADNMTDRIGALTPLASCACPERGAALRNFYDRWKGDRQVVDKWFALQATSDLPGALDEVRSLLRHPDFEIANPNRFRALVGAFSQGNQVRFHDSSGAGYRFLTDQLLRLIPVNPQVSARLLSPLTGWRRYDDVRQTHMQNELRRIRAVPDLPRDVFEVVEKALAE